MHTPLFDVDAQLTWTLLGRVPAALTLVALTLAARRVMGTTRAVLGLSAFCAGAMVGTAFVPSILGALGGGVIAAVLTWRVLGAPLPGPAPFVLTTLALLGVGRIGCLLAGCCFGHLSDSAWAVHYPVGSFAQVLHRELHLVGANEPALPVLPVQLFEALGVVAILACALPLRRLLRRDGPWALFLAAGYLLLRAGLDPLRAMVNTASSLTRVGPASAFQWAAGAVGVGCVVGASLWLRRPVRPAPSPNGEHERRLAGRAALLWALQASAAIAAQPEGTLLLRVFAVVSLAASAVCVVLELGETRRRGALAFAATSVVLLLPAALYAGDTSLDDARPRWLYTAVPGSQHLVRLGTSVTSRPELTRRYLALLQQEQAHEAGASPEAIDGGTVELAACDGGCGEVSPPSVECTAGRAEDCDAAAAAATASGDNDGGVLFRERAAALRARLATDLSPPQPPAEPPAAVPLEKETLDVGLVVLGGQQAFKEPGCGGNSAYQTFGRVGVTVDGRIQTNGRWQARASFLANESRSTSSDGITLGSRSGVFVTGGGLLEYDGQYGGLGIGLVAGLGNLGYFSPWVGNSSGTGGPAADGVRGSVVPLVYFRIEAIRGWAFEVGTGSRFQPAEGAFVDFRFGHDDPGEVAFRVGVESAWFPYPLANSTFFGDLAIPLTNADRLSLRLQGVWGPVSVSGGARFVHSF